MYEHTMRSVAGSIDHLFDICRTATKDNAVFINYSGDSTDLLFESFNHQRIKENAFYHSPQCLFCVTPSLKPIPKYDKSIH